MSDPGTVLVGKRLRKFLPQVDDTHQANRRGVARVFATYRRRPSPDAWYRLVYALRLLVLRREVGWVLADVDPFPAETKAALKAASAQRATLLDQRPQRGRLVYCCGTLGWVTPRDAFEHAWDAYSGWDRD